VKLSSRDWGELEVSVARRRSSRVDLRPYSSRWWVPTLLLYLLMLFFWVERLRIVLWRSPTSRQWRRRPPLVVSRVQSTVASLYHIDGFALSSSSDWSWWRQKRWLETGKLIASGEPREASHGGRWPGLEKMADLFSVRSRMIGSRPFLDLRTRLEDTFSRVVLLKSPWVFSL
jgi:hypothetical protein